MSAPDAWVPEDFVPLHDEGAGLLIALGGHEKDEWLHHLYERLRELGRGLSATTKTSDEYGYRYDERWFNDTSKDLVRLLVVNGETGLHVFIGTRGGGDNDAEDAFRDAVAYAIASMGKRREPVAWEATIAHVPGRRGLRTMGLRVGTGQARDLSIDSWGSVHTEEVTTWFPGLGWRGGPWMFWPIRVTGSVTCYLWDVDGSEAVAPRLRYLIELLTLAFNVPFDVRVGPYEASVNMGGEDDLMVPGLRNPTLPDGHPWGEQPSEPVDVPPWVTDALDGTINTKTRRALSAHYEGMLLKSDHPSMALLAFAASIETLSTPRRPPRCETCRAVQGSGLRFREALAGVLAPDEVELVGKAYDRRSRTVHDGHLHGSEDVLGMLPVLRRYSPDLGGVQFELGTVHLVAKASRQLLLDRLTTSARDAPKA